MVNTCSVAFCKTGCKQIINKVDEIPENHSVFSFPSKKPEIYRLWIKFVNRKEWQPTKNSGICSKHFDEKYLKNGVRTTLRWELNPVPSIYPNLDGVAYPHQFCHPCQPEENHLQEERSLIKLTNLNLKTKSNIFHELTTVSVQEMAINCNFAQERRYFIN